jgi:hypothetical protein
MHHRLSVDTSSARSASGPPSWLRANALPAGGRWAWVVSTVSTYRRWTELIQTFWVQWSLGTWPFSVTGIVLILPEREYHYHPVVPSNLIGNVAASSFKMLPYKICFRRIKECQCFAGTLCLHCDLCAEKYPIFCCCQVGAFNILISCQFPSYRLCMLCS